MNSHNNKIAALFWTIGGIALLLTGGSEFRMTSGLLLCMGGVILSAIARIQERLENEDR